MSIKVLIVEDEDTIRENLAAFLEDEGFETCLAPNGEVALTLLETFAADVAIVDMRLPGMDGNQWILKAHENAKRLRFLIYTGVMDYRLTDALKSLGMSEQDVLFKPLPSMSLISEAIMQKVKSE